LKIKEFEMKIEFYAEEVALPKIDEPIIRKWIKEVALLQDRKIGDISYIFCSDRKILEVNQQYLHHDYYTDIITFDYTQGKRIGGDIYLSIETVFTNAQKFETEYKEELHRAIIHGILHLCGINDKGIGEREIMEAHENEALCLLKSLMSS